MRPTTHRQYRFLPLEQTVSSRPSLLSPLLFRQSSTADYYSYCNAVSHAKERPLKNTQHGDLVTVLRGVTSRGGDATARDVDGTGLQEIEDKTVARKIRDKVNTFNKASAAAVAVATAAYCAIPLH